MLAPNGDLIPNNAGFNSTLFGGSFDGSQAVDNLVSAANAPADNGLIFSGSDTFNPGTGFNAQLAAFNGFNSPISEIWLYSLINDTLRIPAQVTIKSSTTSQTSLNPADYETTLTTAFPLGLAAFSHVPVVVDPVNDPIFPSDRYAIVPVNAPAGTKSLFFDFDNDSTVGGNGTRLQEVQAFFVPEPGSMLMVMLAGSLLAARRSR
jgi:hypothetical protein